MIRLVFVLVVLFLVSGVAVRVLRLIFPLPDVQARAASHAIAANGATRLGRQMEQNLTAHPGQSAVAALGNGHDALASRMTLADTAESSIDAQYYIWHDDTSGILLLDALRRAAERGVRVRLLLDDNGVPGLDPVMAALNALPNFEIRLFNPSAVRRLKRLGYAFDLLRMNRRMHNKAFIVDGAVAIVGGRNVGDEYFDTGAAFYLDMDVLATGTVVPETAAMFDAYWNCVSVIGVDAMITGPGDPAVFAARLAEVEESDAARQLRIDLQDSANRYLSGTRELAWTRVQLIADNPVKGQGIARPDQIMVTRLTSIIGRVERQIDIASAYFVPGLRGTRMFAGLQRRGIRVRILTNALDTTDVLLVHAGYAKYRRKLLKAGVTLFELRLRGGMHPESENQFNRIGVSGASLHAKTFVLDDARVFIGSFNFDPRSALLNCEMGFLIDCAELAQEVGAVFDGPIAEVSYRPRIGRGDRLVWVEAHEGKVTLHPREPGSNLVQRLALKVIGRLPIEWLL